MASLTEAEKLMKSAEKMTKKTLFHKPKWREAGDEYDRAAKVYTQYKNPQKAAEALFEAAKCYSNGEMPAAAAGKYEECGYMLTPSGMPCLNVKLASDAFTQAGIHYTIAGNHKRTSTMLISCAKCLRADAPDEAVRRLKEAIDNYINESRLIYTVEVYDLLLDIQLDSINFKSTPERPCEMCGLREAIKTLESLSSVYQQLNQPHNVRKAILAEVALYCILGDTAQAEELAMGVPDMRQTESEAGLKLLDAAKEEDEALWKQALRHSGMITMYTCVFKLMSQHHFDINAKPAVSIASHPSSSTKDMRFATSSPMAAEAVPGDARFNHLLDELNSEGDSDNGDQDDQDDSYSL